MEFWEKYVHLKLIAVAFSFFHRRAQTLEKVGAMPLRMMCSVQRTNWILHVYLRVLAEQSGQPASQRQSENDEYTGRNPFIDLLYALFLSAWCKVLELNQYQPDAASIKQILGPSRHHAMHMLPFGWHHMRPSNISATRQLVQVNNKYNGKTHHFGPLWLTCGTQKIPLTKCPAMWKAF